MERIPVGNGPYGFFLWLVIKRRWTGGLGRTMGQKMGVFPKTGRIISCHPYGVVDTVCGLCVYNNGTPTGLWIWWETCFFIQFYHPYGVVVRGRGLGRVH